MTARALLILCCAVAPFPSLLSGAAAAAPDRPGDRICREIYGRVEAIDTVPDDAGLEWLEVTVVDESGGEPVRLRVAPGSVLEQEAFPLAVGQTIQARYVLGDDPPVVLRVRDARTGRALRLRCLHGEPLWGYRGEGRQHRRGWRHRDAD